MMNIRYGRFLIQVGAVLVVFILQVGAVHSNLKFDNQLKYLSFGTRTLSIGLLAASLGIASGITLALALLPERQNSSRKNRPLLEAIILGVLPAFAVVLKLIFAVGVVPFSPLRPFSREIWEWAVNSQIPPFWLGLVIGWTVKQLLTAE